MLKLSDSGMEYAKTLLPETLKRSVSTVQTTISRRIRPSAPPRSFTVCTHSRRRRGGLEASSLDDLLEQAAGVLLLSCQVLTLVLEEDGTAVDSEAFFQSLPGDTLLMVLERDEVWTQSTVSPSFWQPKRNVIAKLTFDLYKLHPKDFLGCLTVKASLYDTYMSYDFRCTKAKQMLKPMLRWLTYMTRLTGRLLLYVSSSLLEFIEDEC
ncbi:lipid transferase CIDEA [Diretmus argenteus]